MALFSGEKTWFQYASNLENYSNEINDEKIHNKIVYSQRAVAFKFIEENKKAYIKQVKNEGKTKKDATSIKWIDEIIKTGTYEDKVSGLAFKVSFCSLHNLESLDELLELAKKKFRESKLAVTALKDLFLQSLLPKDRVLNSFKQRKLDEKDIGIEVLVCWWLEDEIKSRYLKFVTIVQEQTQNNLTVVKKDAIMVLRTLIESHCEQEAFILSGLVNKFSDRERTISSSVIFHLTKLLEKHYNMSVVVVNEVESYINRQPSVFDRTVYLATTFLGQLYFSKNDENTFPSRTIDVCIKCVARCLTEQQKKKSYKGKRRIRQVPTVKILSALFSAINRAFPYVQDVTSFDDSIEVLFKSCHSDSFVLSIQSLTLLLKLMKAKKGSSDRFYRALYSLLMNIDVINSTAKLSLFKLLESALKFDKNTLRVLAILKRVLQLGLQGSYDVSLAVLILFQDIVGHKKRFDFLWAKHKVVEPFVKPTKLAVENAEKPHKGMSLNIAVDEPKKVETKEVKSVEEVDTELNKDTEYDPQKRDPLHAFSDAKDVDLLELEGYLFHFHPDVRFLAQSILNNETLGKNFQDNVFAVNTTIGFLDRMAFKSATSDSRQDNSKASLIKKRQRDVLKVNSPEFLEQNVNNLKPSKQFLYKYFLAKSYLTGETVQKVKKRREMIESMVAVPGVTGDFEDEESDDEFATKLAQNMLKEQKVFADIDD